MSITRKDFIQSTGVILASTMLKIPGKIFFGQAFPSKRPLLADRKFRSEAVERMIVNVCKKIKDQELAWLFENCYPNTLDTTVRYHEENGVPDTFIVTGDIDAMWLRDSSAQIWPYLQLAKADHGLRKMILGTINRQAKCINIDPYANAFNEGPTGSKFEKDRTEMKPELHERKWEIDSLCSPIRLAYNYWKITGDTSFFNEDWKKATRSILQTFKDQQRKLSQGTYSFRRLTESSNDTAPNNGYGNPTKATGLIASLFRPSDDATIFPFLIPSNYFAALTLRQLSEIHWILERNKIFSDECLTFAIEIERALNTYGVVSHPKFGKILAYEVDGYGSCSIMDDANVPSLLSLPYLGCLDLNSQIYQNTRKMVLSPENPYYFTGSAGEGVGGPHIGKDYIWPISIIIRALTSLDDQEIINSIRILKASNSGTGLMHESFHKDNPSLFTRKWFAWANTLFGELIVNIYLNKPYLLDKI